MTNHAAARRLAGIVATAVFLLVLASTSVSGAAAVRLDPVVSGLDSPVYVTSAKDGTGRLFVVEQPGRIRVIKNGALLPTPFLDITDQTTKGNEQGALGLAFHPSYRTNGLFYLYFTREDGDIAINQYRASTTNPDVAVRSTARRIITIEHSANTNHNGGMLAFDSTGYLFIGTGDGGGSGDPGNRAQNKDSLLGKLLRINVNGTTGGIQYRIPSGNPFVGKAGRDEIWSYGLRNPWRYSFDRLTGDLWIGDVGQGRYEEIDRSTVGSNRGRGVNFGWRVMEGRHCFSPMTGCNTVGKLWPVVEYSHGGGCSVTGGYVYRGPTVAALSGRYVFADFCSGTIWTVPKGGASPMSKALLMDTDMNISSFGEDERGELYVVDHGGSILRFAGG